MLFQHTIDKVLDGTKTQTSRIWKESYLMWFDDAGKPEMVLVNGFTGYHVHRTYSVQPGRGKKGIARIRITGLAKRDVRDFDAEAIQREGFETYDDFLSLWRTMHGENYTALVIQFELVP